MFKQLGERMKTKLFLAGILAATISTFAATNDLTSTLQRGLFEEEANQNLEAAAQAYQSVSMQFDKDRKLAATAIFRLGEIYRKQGRTNEATAQYERIVREFSDQPTLVTMSQQNLAGMNGGRAEAKAASSAHLGTSRDLLSQYNQQKALLERLKKLKFEELQNVLPRVMNDPVLQGTLKQLNEAEVKMAEAKKDYSPNHPKYLLVEEVLKVTQQQFKDICESALKSLEIEVDSLKEAIDAQGSGRMMTTASTVLTANEEELARSERILVQLKGWDLSQLRKLIPSLAADAEFDRLNKQLTLAENFGDAADKSILQQREEYRKKLQDRADVIITTLENRVAALKNKTAKETSRSRVAKTSETGTTDEEEKEIQRIKLMVQNSPDLINALDGAYTPLGKAADAGWLRVAKFLLDNGASINRSSSGSTPLHLAAGRGHKAMVELLVGRGADLEAHDATGATPLHLAAENGFLSVAEVLVQHKADLNSRNSKSNNEQTPLHRAAEKGHPAMVAYLISKGADVNARNSKGVSAIFLAARAGYVEVVTNLLASGADKELEENDGRTVLSYTAERGQTNMVAILLAAKANPNGGKIDLPLAAAARGKQLEAARLLLNAGADPNLAGKSTTSAPAPGPNYSRPGVSGPYVPLQVAVSKSDTAMVKLLLSFKADPNTLSPWSTPPFILAGLALFDSEMLRAFLDAGADANAEISSGWPLLSRAAANGFSEPVELLLAHGAKPDAKDNEGRTAISRAAEQNCLKCVQSLIAAKATVDATDPSGMTALNWAIFVANREMAEALLAAAADANQKDKNGDTPLHYAARMRTPTEITKTMELLLSKGADPNVRNNARATPLDVAKTQPSYASGVRSIPIRSVGSRSEQAAASGETRTDILTTLRKHGALDELPDLDTISITRGTMKPITLMNRDSAGNNHFTLFEALINYYSRSVSANNTALPPNFELQKTGATAAADRGLAFPDFTAIRILRQTGGKATDRKEIIVNALNATNAFDGTKDVPLEFGDVIEIPEREYTLAESSLQIGLTKEQRESLLNCTKRTVTFAVRGEKVEITRPGNDATLSSAILQPKVQSLLRSTSDLARTKVQRVDSQGGKKVELTVDAQPKNTNDRLWLKDGDFIEVPDKL